MDGKGEMDRTERFYKIDQLLNDMTVVPLATFLDDLGISLATFKRDLEYMRERLNAPIQWDRDNASLESAQRYTVGMNRTQMQYLSKEAGGPRTRGDEPEMAAFTAPLPKCSPHARG